MPALPRLNAPLAAGRLRYDRAQVTPGIVHLGIGAFHRAHQAAMIDLCLAAGDLRWGIVGASLRSGDVAAQLNPQDGLYTLVVRDGERIEDRLIGAVQRVIVAPEAPGALLAALAAPTAHLVTLTITEKGYRLDPASGALLQTDADVAADLASLARPRTAAGYIVAALAGRRAAGAPPLTILSCDNLPHNGVRLRRAVLAMAEAHDPALAEWIDRTIGFPQTMIDRIVPATTPQDISDLADRTGYRDEGAVKAEPFSQWVIEDRFAGERPDLAAAGAQLTRDVAPWEEAKLRLLNGAHSALSYLGALAGIAHVDQVVARPAGRRLVEALWDEAQVTLDPPAELDLAAYRQALMARFANSALAHRTRQIAMDGSQKLPQRLLATIAARKAAGLASPALTLGVAAWMQWVTSDRDEAGAPITVDDPLAGTFATIRGAPADRVRALLAIAAVFPQELATDESFAAALTADVERLGSGGAGRILAG